MVVPFTTQLNSRRAGAGGAGIAAAAAAGPRAQSSSSSDSDSDDNEDDDDDDSDEKDDEGEGPSLRKVGKGLLGSVITGVSIARNSLDSSARDELDAIEKGQGGDGRPERNKKTRRTGKGKRGARGFSVKKKKAQQEAPPVWLHCSVGEPMDDEELAAETLREAAAAGGTTSGGLEGVRFPFFFRLLSAVLSLFSSPAFAASATRLNSGRLFACWTGLNGLNPTTIAYTSVCSLLHPLNRHTTTNNNNNNN